MGACLSAAEPILVVAMSDVEEALRKKLVEVMTQELKEVILPECIKLLNMEEDKLQKKDVASVDTQP